MQTEAEEDSLVMEGLLEPDSTENRMKGLVGILPQLVRGYERLIGDVVYLERLIGSQRVEMAITDVDCGSVSMHPFRRQMIRAVQTNLGKDGSSTDFFDYPARSSRLFLILISVL